MGIWPASVCNLTASRAKYKCTKMGHGFGKCRIIEACFSRLIWTWILSKLKVWCFFEADLIPVVSKLIYLVMKKMLLGCSTFYVFLSNNRPHFVVWQFNDILNTIFSSPPSVAIIVGTILDNTLDARHAANDRGLPWWVPFQNRKGDVRNDEFYSLPLRINEYMPTRFL